MPGRREHDLIEILNISELFKILDNGKMNEIFREVEILCFHLHICGLG